MAGPAGVISSSSTIIYNMPVTNQGTLSNALSSGFAQITLVPMNTGFPTLQSNTTYFGCITINMDTSNPNSVSNAIISGIGGLQLQWNVSSGGTGQSSTTYYGNINYPTNMVLPYTLYFTMQTPNAPSGVLTGSNLVYFNLGSSSWTTTNPSNYTLYTTGQIILTPIG
jgi:hypothetical protein